MITLTLKHVISSLFLSVFLSIVSIAPAVSEAAAQPNTCIPLIIQHQSDSKQLLYQNKSLPSLPSVVRKPAERRVFIPRGSCIRLRLTEREIRARRKAFKKMIRRWRASKTHNTVV